ncbi:thiamine phosphate synthase [Lederbergia sp. NSJ-179]|uniref:thiamine phosphate synthase n=1 Tax=Lederbergia sp. NSJ-179 TaxID=2931402 RepID=UPI001FD3B04F|nr:thiamine phosphate synthase [Lederbergia sp. NSJ-179]MCJ7841007.1 thiamine phosphate synthase [Lederbergia sp. NSJ-179]
MLRLYFIMGSTNTQERDPLEVLEKALQGGVTCFQLREKGTKSLKKHEKYLFAEKCQRLCNSYDVPFIVNDDVALALALDADGVHIGQEDESATIVRKQIGPQKILGVSVHNLEEAFLAKEAGANYIGMGPVYATSSKKDAKAPAGTRMIKQVAATCPDLPIVGIGGITEENVGPVLESGAAGVALISAIASSQNPFEHAKRLRKTIEEAFEKEEDQS